MSLYPRHTDSLEAMHAKHLDDWLRGREGSIVNNHISLEGSDERSGLLMCAEERYSSHAFSAAIEEVILM